MQLIPIGPADVQFNLLKQSEEDDVKDEGNTAYHWINERSSHQRDRVCPPLIIGLDLMASLGLKLIQASAGEEVMSIQGQPKERRAGKPLDD